jgi:protein-tyrosine phosphatase
LSASDRIRTVLFLCTGNYYRSRFAEILFNAEAARRRLAWRAASRGLAIELGVNNIGPLSVHTAERLAALGIACDGHVRMPLQACAADLAAADLVIALKEDEHRPLLVERHPGWADRVEYWHVHDLYDVGPDDALPQIEHAVAELVARLAG